jgi:hypothetical protein
MLSISSIPRNSIFRLTQFQTRLFTSSVVALKKASEPTFTELKKADKPKRPTSAYLFYYKENFKRFKKEDKTNSTEIAKSIAAEWNELPETAKAKYVELSKKASEEYKKAMEEWSGKYKKPLNGYNKFMKVNMKIPKGTSLEDASKVMKEWAAKWSALSDAEKEEWKNKEI